MRKAGLAVGIALAVSLVGVAFVSWTLWTGSSEAENLPLERGANESTLPPATAIDVATNMTSIPESTSSASDTLRNTLVEHRKPRDGPTVTFVEAESSRPRPDVAVWMVLDDEVTEEEWDALERFDDDAEKLIEERGHFVELDGLATATLPGKDGNAMLFASADDRRLRRTIPLEGTERMVLRLVRREALTLLAADPNGRRQRDVPVSLQSLLRGEPWQPPSRVVFSRPTDEDGEAMAPFGSELLDQHLDADGLATVRVVVAALAFPCRDPCATLVDPRVGCEAPVKLVTPPRSALKFHAVDAKGSTLAADVIVEATAAESVESSIPVLRAWRTRIPAGRKGEMTVEAEIPVHLAAWTVDGRFEMTRVTETTPAVAMTRVVTLTLEEVAIEPGWPEVAVEPGWAPGRVRVIDVTGRPCAATEICWQVDSGKMPRKDRLERGVTDANGILSFQFQRSASPSQTVRQLDVFDGVESPLSRGSRRHGSTRFPDRARSTVVDAGQIELRDVLFLVEGRVLDRDGLGVPDVDVEVRESIRDPQAQVWSTRTGADGAFWIRTWTNIGRLLVWPSKAGWYRIDEFNGSGGRRPIEVEAGTRDLEITMRQKGFVRGRVLVDPGISLRDLKMDALPKPSPDIRFRFDPDGRFFLEGTPGRRSIVVQSELGRDDSRLELGFDQPVAEIDDVLLEEGKETIDRRLDPIDLRGELRQIELRVTSDEEPVFGAAIYLTRTRGIQKAPRATDPFGRAIVTTPTFDSGLAIISPEHVFRLFPFDRTTADVELEPAIVVRVTVEGPVESLLSSKSIRPDFNLQSADGGWVLEELWSNFPPVLRWLDGRTFEFLATVEGKYWLGWEGRVGRDEWSRIQARPDSISVRGRRRVDVVEKFSEEEVRKVSSGRRRR